MILLLGILVIQAMLVTFLLSRHIKTSRTVQGFFFGMLYSISCYALFTDLLGLDKYIMYLKDNWMQANVLSWLGFNLGVVVSVLYMFKAARLDSLARKIAITEIVKGKTYDPR